MIEHLEFIDILGACFLVPLLVLSGFFSSSETVLFGLDASERRRLHAIGPTMGRVIEGLLARPRQLLITILLCNMTVNTLYMVISSVLVVRSRSHWLLSVSIAIGSLLCLIIFGEVIPKLMVRNDRVRFGRLLGPPMLLVHRGLGPLRTILDLGLISPLSRLTAPETAPSMLQSREIHEAIDNATAEGEISPLQDRLLDNIIQINRLRVRDVMVPRVEVAALDIDDGHEQALELIRHHNLTRVPVYEGDLDTIVGVLDLKSYLLGYKQGNGSIRQYIRAPRFVPEISPVEGLLGVLRPGADSVAIAVDEYGGTAGVVTLEDLIEELVGEIPEEGGKVQVAPMLIGPSRWRISGEMGIHDFIDAFRVDIDPGRISTVGGLVMDRLGHVPDAGEFVDIENLHMQVESMGESRIESLLVSVQEPQS